MNKPHTANLTLSQARSEWEQLNLAMSVSDSGVHTFILE